MKNENSCGFTSTVTRKILIVYQLIYVIIAILIKSGVNIFSVEMGTSILVKLSVLSLLLILIYILRERKNINNDVILRERKNINNDIGLLLLMTSYSVQFLVFAGE